MVHRKWVWTDLQRERAGHVLEIVNGLLDYLPLTIRQIFYELVARQLRPKNKSHYSMHKALLKYMRLEGTIPWEHIIDDTRPLEERRGWQDAEQCSRTILWEMRNYTRCLMQSQEVYLEAWVEKFALGGVFRKVTHPLCIQLVRTRGFASQTIVHDYVARARHYMEQGRQPVILFFSDHDPQGLDMFRSLRHTIQNEHLLNGVVFERPALTWEQVQEYALPSDVDGVKGQKAVKDKYIKEYGDNAINLDAMPVRVLHQIIHDSIARHVDMELVEEERGIEARERAALLELAEGFQDKIREMRGFLRG